MPSNTATVYRSHRRRALWLFVGLGLTISLTGCLSSKSQWVTVRESPKNPLSKQLNLMSRGGPEPSSRTKQLLRRKGLEGQIDDDLAGTLEQLIEMHQASHDREVQYSIAELAYLAAKQAERKDAREALAFYGSSLVHAYDYLFDQRHTKTLNPYDPQFRSICDLYNQSLEGTLRLVQAEGNLRPGTERTINTVKHSCKFDIVMFSSGWHDEDFDTMRFASDYKLAGLKNHYHTYGLGVPIIAERRTHEGETGAEQFYPDKLTFPLTAFLRIERVGSASAQHTPPRLVLELHDPLDRQTVNVAGTRVPLESDLSTPLAYFLNQPDFEIENVSTLGLLNPDKAQHLQGLYMLEPYDPQKMPVVMVHGLWSSPVTWMEMFNDLRSDPSIRENYQFWFYLYPTGQPFWISATQMREDIASMRLKIDPHRQAPTLDQMVLVGHSMGGLVSKLQSVDSGTRFWSTMSDQPFAALQAEDELKMKLQRAFFFQPNPSVRRVVTIGTPHSGSNFANDLTQWAADKFIRLPMKLVSGREALLADNKDYFKPGAPIGIRTSIDSLDPESVLLSTLRGADPAPWISYHNIVGQQEVSGFSSWFAEDGDGVVSLESARLDGLPNVRSQMVVPADHLMVHRHPRAVLEVKRILLQQVAELQRSPFPDYSIMVASATERNEQTEPPNTIHINETLNDSLNVPPPQNQPMEMLR